MAKKGKVKKTLVDQILDKAKIDHDSLSFNGLEGELPEDVARESIYKTLALKGDKTGPVIGIVPITEHLSEKKLAKISGNKKVQMIPKGSQKTTGYVHGANNPVEFAKKHNFPYLHRSVCPEAGFLIVSAEKLGALSVSIVKNLLILLMLNLLILRSNHETVFLYVTVKLSGT